MLDALQKHLADIYQADCGYRVSDFLLTDRSVASGFSGQPLEPGVEETVLVTEDDNGMAVSVFLDQDLLARLAGESPLHRLDVGQLRDLAVVIEGVSHFNYLAWSAAQDKSVTLLELELQAEIDKFVATMLIALEQDELEFARKLHQWLFDEVRYQPSLDRDQQERYEMANDYAGRFCHRLLDRIGNDPEMRELRSFYRLTQAEKISHIHATAWAGGSSQD